MQNASCQYSISLIHQILKHTRFTKSWSRITHSNLLWCWAVVDFMICFIYGLCCDWAFATTNIMHEVSRIYIKVVKLTIYFNSFSLCFSLCLRPQISLILMAHCLIIFIFRFHSYKSLRLFFIILHFINIISGCWRYFWLVDWHL